MKTILLIATLLVLQSQAIYLNLESKERYCFKIPLVKDEEVKIHYVISG